MTTTTQPSIKNIANGLGEWINRHSKPKSHQIHLIPGQDTAQLFVVNGSRLFTISKAVEQQFRVLITFKTVSIWLRVETSTIKYDFDSGIF